MSTIAVAIAVMSVANFITRVFPFLFFKDQKMPTLFVRVGVIFPGIIMTILVLYSISKDTAIPGGREALGVVVTSALHLWRNDYLLSILGGTLFFMILTQWGAGL